MSLDINFKKSNLELYVNDLFGKLPGPGCSKADSLNANPRLQINQGEYFSFNFDSQMLFNADIRQNFTLEEVAHLKQKKLSPKTVENMKQKFTLTLD